MTVKTFGIYKDLELAFDKFKGIKSPYNIGRLTLAFAAFSECLLRGEQLDRQYHQQALLLTTSVRDEMTRYMCASQQESTSKA